MRLRDDLRTARRLATHPGDEMAESPAADTEEQRAAAVPVGWAVRTLGRRMPWMSQCLVQSVAATWMLHRRRIPSTLCFGLATDADGRLKAHAWVRSGAKVLAGANRRHDFDFKVIATFAEPDLSTGADCALRH